MSAKNQPSVIERALLELRESAKDIRAISRALAFPDDGLAADEDRFDDLEKRVTELEKERGRERKRT